MRLLSPVVLLLVGCVPESQVVSFSVSENVVTVIEVDLDLQEGSHWIEYRGGAGELLSTSKLEGPGEFQLPLLGLQQATDVEFYLVSEEDGSRIEGDVNLIRTGTLPTWIPRSTVLGETQDGFMLMTYIGGDPNGLVIVDGSGEVVWYWALPTELVTTEAQFKTGNPDTPFEALLLLGDRSYTADKSAIYRIASNGKTLEEVAAPYAHHSFTQGPGSDLSWIAGDVRELDEIGPVMGDKLVRYNGQEHYTVRSMWDLFEEPDEEELDQYKSYTPLGKDWTHANGVVWTPERDSYLFSLRNKHTVLELSREGQVIMSFGQDGDYQFDSSSELPYEQHGTNWIAEDRLMLLSLEPTGTRAVEFLLDSDEMTAKRVWDYGLDDDGKSYVLGSIQYLEDGRIVVNWGSRGLVERFSVEREPVWGMSLDAGSFLGSAVWIKDLYGR